REPEQIPEQRVVNIHADTVDAEQPVGDDAVEDMPDAKADQGIPEQATVSAGGRELTAGPPEQPRPDAGDNIHQGVEQTVGQDQEADILPRLLDAAEQVVPLEHLMEHDAVQEAAEAEAEGVARPIEAA